LSIQRPGCTVIAAAANKPAVRDPVVAAYLAAAVGMMDRASSKQ